MTDPLHSQASEEAKTYCKHCRVEIRPAGGGAWMDIETCTSCDRDDLDIAHEPDAPTVQIKDFPFAGTHCANPAGCPVCSTKEPVAKLWISEAVADYASAWDLTIEQQNDLVGTMVTVFDSALDRVSRERTRQALEKLEVREGRLMKMLRDVLGHVEDETVPREGNQCTLCYSWRARIRALLSDGESVASAEKEE